MKRCIFSWLLLMSFFTVMACGSALKKDEIEPWLQEVSGDNPPAINIEGQWQDVHADGPFGWGKGVIEQDGKRVEGSLGDYNLQGRVSENTVYLVFISGGEVYYTARLEKKGDKLRGDYFYADDPEQERGEPIALEKVE